MRKILKWVYEWFSLKIWHTCLQRYHWHGVHIDRLSRTWVSRAATGWTLAHDMLGTARIGWQIIWKEKIWKKLMGGFSMKNGKNGKNFKILYECLSRFCNTLTKFDGNIIVWAVIRDSQLFLAIWDQPRLSRSFDRKNTRVTMAVIVRYDDTSD